MRDRHYDILLLDFLMSPIMGDRVINEVRTFDKEIYIILLTGHKSMAPPVRALRELDIQGYYEKRALRPARAPGRKLRKVHSADAHHQAYRDDLDEKNKQLEKMYASLGDSYGRDQDPSPRRRREGPLHARPLGPGFALRAAHRARHGTGRGLLRRVRIAGLFHDVGKVAVPDSILLKPGKLNSAEYEIIMMHPEKGYQILSAISAFDDIAEIVLEHHERYDGSGYLRGIAGEDTREEARIISVADAFDAMTSNRLYRDNLTFDYALNQLVTGRGGQFDPEAVDAFLGVLKEYDTLKQEVAWTFGQQTEEQMP